MAEMELKGVGGQPTIRLWKQKKNNKGLTTRPSLVTMNGIRLLVVIGTFVFVLIQGPALIVWHKVVFTTVYTGLGSPVALL